MQTLVYGMRAETRRQNIVLFHLSWGRACHMPQIFHSVHVQERLGTCPEYCFGAGGLQVNFSKWADSPIFLYSRKCLNLV